jgi:hypothetical protein
MHADIFFSDSDWYGRAGPKIKKGMYILCTKNHIHKRGIIENEGENWYNQPITRCGKDLSQPIGGSHESCVNLPSTGSTRLVQ